MEELPYNDPSEVFVAQNESPRFVAAKELKTSGASPYRGKLNRDLDIISKSVGQLNAPKLKKLPKN